MPSTSGKSTDPEPAGSTNAKDSRAASEPLKAVLPAELEPGKITKLEVPKDKPLYVIQGRAETERGMLYLHGVCGNVFAIEAFAETASQFATLVALLGDGTCPGGKRHKWGLHIPSIEERVETALKVVQQSRHGQLDLKELTVFGYSQGATRAQRLAAAYPERYPYVILGGLPVPPDRYMLRKARGVVILGGEREETGFMEKGAHALSQDGVPARFWKLPGAAHGEFGKRAPEILSEALSWLYQN